MRYIRFLKPPRIVRSKTLSPLAISTLVTVTSDLGDSFLPYDVTLYVDLVTEDGPRICGTEVQWTAGMRSLAISLPIASLPDPPDSQIRVGTQKNVNYDEMSLLSDMPIPGVVSAWSAPINLDKNIDMAEKFVQRRFGAHGTSGVHLWEETGESIARHIWDAGFALYTQIAEAAKEDPHPLAKALSPPKGKDRLQVLELGTGCGIVGILIAQNSYNVDVVLTDLPEAQDITKRNIKAAVLANGATLQFKTLDWEEEIPKDLNDWTKCQHCVQFDLIVASDCTYNPDSSPALVTTMSRLVKASPNAVIAVAMKMRHSSEEVFFSLMSDAGFKTAHVIEIPLPGDEELGEETALVYLYYHQAANLSTEPCTGSPNPEHSI
ncbi:hypothetical protein K504DRAFT_481607 [Pleomassaria siparia CBS 279.74]|uniref:Uncharacterized protein n=1 Tax=Pleomassaria siparia CBS 279.74 TaxID=1314801 RepID=A0A6G1KCL3_9PLEO|nr:hypothetical protein K504DRAFT_481607 [Pleomassaria siparia CBS 279.74]